MIIQSFSINLTIQNLRSYYESGLPNSGNESFDTKKNSLIKSANTFAVFAFYRISMQCATLTPSLR